MAASGGRLSAAADDDCMNAVPGPRVAALKFQDPSQADQLTKIMQDLEETKVVLHNTIEAALERGQKIDDLVSKSNTSPARRSVLQDGEETEPVLLVHMSARAVVAVSWDLQESCNSSCAEHLPLARGERTTACGARGAGSC